MSPTRPYIVYPPGWPEVGRARAYADWEQAKRAAQKLANETGRTVRIDIASRFGGGSRRVVAFIDPEPTIRRFRKKPVIIEAYQYLTYGLPAPGVCVEGCIPGPHVHTREGALNVRRGDWIIRGVKGEYYPCAPDVFELTYEPVEE